jgi:predicted nucleic acid-binding protein
VRYLVDANVLSEPTRSDPDRRVVDWLRAHERDLVVDPVILGEVRFGILLLPRGAKRTRLEAWFSDGIAKLECLSWDAACGLRWAELLAELRSRGRAMTLKDSLIATTALVHELVLATRNGSHFEPAGIGVHDPFAR